MKRLTEGLPTKPHLRSLAITERLDDLVKVACPTEGWDFTAEDGGLSTACVFLTAADQGRHCDNPETGECWCCALYGEPKPWGCEWFEKWKILVTEAVEKGQMIIVFYKAGHLARVGAEHQFSRVFAPASRGGWTTR